MRIRFALTGYLPEIFGGAEVYTHRLARGLQKAGHDVGVACLDFKHRRGIPSDDHFEGIPVHRFGYGFDHLPAPLYLLQCYPAVYEEASRWLQKVKPDVVHMTNAWFMHAFALAALHLQIPVVATHVDFQWVCRESHFLLPDYGLCEGPPKADCRQCHPEVPDDQWVAFKNLRDRMIHALATGYAFHHCPCPLMAKHLEGIGVLPERIGIWPYGVEVPKPSLRKESIPYRLAFLGRWNRIKGIDLLLDAVKDAGGDFLLHIFGEQEAWNSDSYTGKLYEKASTVPNVRLMGRFAPENLHRVLGQVDALILPSIWPENSPVSILEALAMGVPVICADGAGMTNIVTHEKNGLVFQSGNVADLQKQIRRFVKDSELRNKLRAGARCLGSIDQDVRTFEKIYQKAMIEKNADHEEKQIMETFRKIHGDATLLKGEKSSFQNREWEN